MFNIGFSELLIIGVIGVLVVGPERLPGLVRTVMIYTRKIRHSFNSVKSDIERELELDELRRSIEQIEIKEDIERLNQSIMDADKEIRDSLDFDDDFHDDDHDLAADLLAKHAEDDYSDTGIEVDEEETEQQEDEQAKQPKKSGFITQNRSGKDNR